jgi:hypothetical protein
LRGGGHIHSDGHRAGYRHIDVYRWRGNQPSNGRIDRNGTVIEFRRFLADFDRVHGELPDVAYVNQLGTEPLKNKDLVILEHTLNKPADQQ